jgi:hypothetical protein
MKGPGQRRKAGACWKGADQGSVGIALLFFASSRTVKVTIPKITPKRKIKSPFMLLLLYISVPPFYCCLVLLLLGGRALRKRVLNVRGCQES